MMEDMWSLLFCLSTMRLLTNLDQHSDQIKSIQAARTVLRRCVRGRSIGINGTLGNEFTV
jgi:hypothetical protein